MISPLPFRRMVSLLSLCAERREASAIPTIRCPTSPRARAPRSIDRSTPFAPRRARERKNDLERSARPFPLGQRSGSTKRRRGDFSFFDLADFFFLRVLGRCVCVCVCSKTDPLPRAKKFSSLSLSHTHALFLSRARVTTERTKEELRLVVLVHSLRVFLPHDSLLTEKSGRGV